MRASKVVKAKRWTIIFDLLLVYVLLMGAYFRFTGIDWGEYQYLHPDERFLVWVGTDISPVKCLDPAYTFNTCPAEQKAWMSLGEYFDTVNSTLNPNNQGHGFYVYGTLPVFMARYGVEWVFGHSGFNEMTDIGRPLSAAMDLLTVVLVYLIAARLYDRRVGIVAAAFSAVVVMQIQLAHYFTVDTFLNFFTYLAIYFAVRIATTTWHTTPRDIVPMVEKSVGIDEESDGIHPAGKAVTDAVLSFIRHPYFVLSIAFGFALGSAVASKLNAAPVAIMLPGAFALTLLPLSAEERRKLGARAIGYLVVGAVVSLLVFRLFQPYAFSGPGFFGFKPNPQWVDNIREQRTQAAGDIDFPPAMQWARRPLWFSGKNLMLWGLGVPLGALAWTGFLWAGWRLLADRSAERAPWKRHALLWGWTAFYFTWQSLAFNPTMRYQLPIYPALAIFAGWAVIQLYDRGRLSPGSGRVSVFFSGRRAKVLALFVGGGVFALTAAWAFAFSNIYTRPITRVAASRWIYQNVPGPINLKIQTGGGIYSQPVPFPAGTVVAPGQPYLTTFTPKVSGILGAVYLAHALDTDNTPQDKSLQLIIYPLGSQSEDAVATLVSNFNVGEDPRGEDFMLEFSSPVEVDAGAQYRLEFSLNGESGALTLSGAAPANETSWDDGLPLRIDGYDGYGGIYQPGLNFEMYWDDNPEKLARFESILDQADYLFISSSRQWGSLPRLPERYPLTTVYYRNLLGCPQEIDLEQCYNIAQPGMYNGNLGFELVQVFESHPSLGPWKINDQPSEEAFTVYDHPKVFIFHKTKTYDRDSVQAILGAVDLTSVVHVTPKRAAAHPANLLLPSERWAAQQAGGTWSKLFSDDFWVNQSPVLAVVLWYISLGLLGLVAYPLVRLALGGLSDRGYPVARTVGLLSVSYLVWLAGSLGLTFNRLTIWAALAVLTLLGGWAAWHQREALAGEWRRNRGYFLAIEALFLAFFLFDLLIRLGNPDLWHPWKGGEKPMDFAYFNAVLKSTSFPPYDPWYAGGYLNYYYYGFVFSGVWVKLLGIAPASAYNLILPTIFSMIAIGAFSVSWNLMAGFGSRSGSEELNAGKPRGLGRLRLWLVGLAGALGMAVLGNLGTVRMIYQGYQRLAAPGGVIDDAGLFTRAVWAIRGAAKALSGISLPYGLGDWYWIPSRAIPAPGEVEPITEFPFFTVLYADPHAHLFALPIALLVLAFAVGFILNKGRWSHWVEGVAAFLLGGLAIGALKPTNTWDFYPYLALGSVAVGYTLLQYYDAGGSQWPIFRNLPATSQRILAAGLGMVLLVGLSLALYQPYSAWYGLGYGRIDLWRGSHTPLSAYLTHWGLFLFVIISWMFWETRQWLAQTPLSALRKLEPYRALIQSGLFVMLVIVLVLLYLQVHIAWFVLPLALWAGILLLRPAMPDAKRIVLFLVGTGLVLTLMVEVIVLRGDIARMNTVFKFYLQVWTLFAISAGAALGWVIQDLKEWTPRFQSVWRLSLAALVFGAALFPLLGGLAKIKDRMAPRAPHTLDGTAFMEYANYGETWGVMDLSEDFRAIHWMQENVGGSPVIVEANLRNLYRWGSRFSIYTGLPGVVGWEWHQQQQRALLPGNWVSDRIAEIDEFYTTTDLEGAQAFLRKYNVQYIVLGQQERGHYAGDGLNKFTAADGVLWQAVYQDGSTTIYKVMDF